jgi:hypothetical protein
LGDLVGCLAALISFNIFRGIESGFRQNLWVAKESEIELLISAEN